VDVEKCEMSRSRQAAEEWEKETKNMPKETTSVHHQNIEYQNQRVNREITMRVV